MNSQWLGSWRSEKCTFPTLNEPRCQCCKGCPLHWSEDNHWPWSGQVAAESPRLCRWFSDFTILSVVKWWVHVAAIFSGTRSPWCNPLKRFLRSSYCAKVCTMLAQRFRDMLRRILLKTSNISDTNQSSLRMPRKLIIRWFISSAQGRENIVKTGKPFP